MRIRFFLSKNIVLAAAFLWLVVAALGNPVAAQQLDSAILVQPRSLLHPDIPRTDCRDDTITLTNIVQGTIPVTVWLASGSANVASGWTLQGISLDSLQRATLDVPLRTSTSIPLRFCGTAPVGSVLRDTLMVSWGNAGSLQTRTVPLQATITPVWAAPADTAFPNPIAVGGRDSLTVLAVNRTSKPITITTARLESPFGDQGYAILAPTSQTTVGPRQSLPVRVQFTANAQFQSPVLNTVIINERDTLTELRIGLQASVVPASPLPPQLSDTALRFGPVRSGQCKVDSFTVTSPANTLLRIDSVTIEGINNQRDLRYRVIRPVSFPVTMQSSTAVAFVVEFCPGANNRPDDTTATLRLHYQLNGQQQQSQVELFGSMAVDTVLPTITPLELDFGAVKVDTCVTDTITIVGEATHQVTRAEFWRNNQRVDTRFTLVEPTVFPLVIAPSGVRLVVRFCPDSTIADTTATLFLSTSWTNSPIAILLHGSTAQQEPPLVERNAVRLSRATGEAGNSFQLPMALVAPIRADQNVQSLFFRIRMPARALYPTQVTNAAGATIPHSYAVAHAADTAAGTLTFKIPGPITGQTVARVQLMGLATGYPETVVAVDSVAVDSPFITIDTASGVVELEGCEIGKGLSFTKRARVTSIRPNPLTDGAAIRYIAPIGARPTLRLVDLLGGTARTVELPAGIGREEVYHPNLDGVPAGIYLLEIAVGSEKNAIPIIIAEGGG
ncbi:MAG: hypothetical protein IPM61_05390 [Chlorobi bacterium]|nr:hypothetical protein [Chlorobiota bacterium]MBX7217309.1 hypothetical protein [Candidatus Kapabacteria bacterium]